MNRPALGQVTYKAVYLPNVNRSIVSVGGYQEVREFSHAELEVVEHWVIHEAMHNDRDRADFQIRAVVETIATETYMKEA